jgi:hydroxymethylpyrimidine pyrophosphatase-like HAD family hydrolase
MASGPSRPTQNAHRPLPAAFLATESAFYSQYSWCLNAFPTIREVVEHLLRQFSLLDPEEKGWQQSEVITNIFLFSCAITDTVDDYLVGKTYDFSKASQALPFSGPGVRVLEKLVGFWGRSREAWLFPLRRWRGVWTKAVTEFLRESLVADPVPTILLKQRDHLASLLPPPFPLGLWNRRPNVPAFFRSRDFAPSDGLELARKFLAEFPERERPAMLIGLRTAGSFLAPLACAYLSQQLQETSWVTIRPGKGLASWEQRALRGAAGKKARALIVDESIHSGQTLAKAINLLRRVGFREEDIVVLNPVEPALPDWKTSPIFQSFSRIRVITLEPVERYKQRLLESERAVETRLDEYFRARGYLEARVVPSLEVEEWNGEWRTEPPERTDIRLKRVYKVHLQDAAGVSEVRYVLAKSIGWGWLGYHAFIAGQLLAGWVPPILGLRDGILYSEWWPQKQHPTSFGSNRETGIALLASYVATRAQKLSLQSDPVPDLARAGRHKGLELLADLLSRAYSSRIVAAIKRPQIQRELSRQNGFVPVLTDSKMSPEEWIVAGGRVMKSDFEHHCFGKNELGISDPAFDLASAIFHFGLSETESAHLVRSYVQQSGDQNVAERLFFNKLLASMRAQSMAIGGLQHGRLLSERSAFNQQYLSAWNFLVGETVRECGKLCQRPEEIGWHAPVVVVDIDGVLDRMVFGFPSTTAAGIQAVSLLHGHGFAMAVNTARTLGEVKEYCRAYGFAGGVAEYGSILWDRTHDRASVLVSAESLEQLHQVRNALRRIPGCFLNDDYRYSLRVFTYQNGRTVPLPALLVQDLLASLKVDRLCAHHTGLDTAIIAKETDKGRGLLSLLDFVGLTGMDVLAIGDSEPDLPMFRVAGRSFAPGNVTCRREAQLLGCHIADSLYQPGLLEIARRIVHPEGGSCDHCQSIEAGWPKDGNLFVSLLSAADQKPTSLLLRNLLNPSLLAAFRK